MRAMLEHADGACVGNWRLVGSGWTGGRRITCEQCAATHPAEPEQRLAAMDENYAGIYLRRLTAEGRVQLEAQSTPTNRLRQN